MSEDSFFRQAKTWSKRKHRILAKYLKPFSAKVGSWAGKIFIVDSFAGRGRYDDGTEGSPLLTARLADECQTWSKPVDIHIINVESKHENYLSLVEATTDSVSREVTTNREGAFRTLIPEILLKLGNHAGFFFIDPYGPSHLHFSDLEVILTRNAVTELIINFNLSGLCRIADAIRMETPTEKVLKTKNSDIALVDSIMGTSEWQRSFKEEHTARAAQLLKAYMEKIASYRFNVVAYPIRESFQSSPKYYLIYCTRHPDGVNLMNTIIRQEEDELIKEIGTSSGEALLSADFNLEPEVARRRKELRILVLSFCEPDVVFTRGEIKSHFIGIRFGDFEDKDYNAVVQDLIEEGRFITEHGRKRINDETTLKLARLFGRR